MQMVKTANRYFLLSLLYANGIQTPFVYANPIRLDDWLLRVFEGLNIKPNAREPNVRDNSREPNVREPSARHKDAKHSRS